jgi:hypothetical protein
MSICNDVDLQLLLARMFSDPRKRDKAWITDDVSDLPGKAMHGDRISYGDATLYFISPFAGKRPYLYDYEYLHGGNNNVNFVPTILCDSNLANYLHKLVTTPQTLSPAWKAVCLEFLRKVKALRYELQANVLSS